MTSRIHLLSVPLQHKIAAGEVVERPASALKEILENSVDAGATDITVELVTGGIDRISVPDNGCGMSREDAEVAFQRYATSKLASDDDLFRIGTYGFRGEALASISAVSEVVVETRERDALSGTRVAVKASERTELTECGCAEGTTVTISKLFFNTPVRRKYLKSVTTEQRHSLDVFIDQALSYPERAFRLIANGKMLFDLRPEAGLDRVVHLLGEDWKDMVLPVDFDAVPYVVRGFIGRPGFARDSRRHQYLFVNGRRVDDHLVAYRVKHAYSTLLDPRLHPPFVLNIQMPYELVDVNVHPRKAQVKFLQTSEVYQAVEGAVIATLQSNNLVPLARLVDQHNVAPSVSPSPSFKPNQQDFSRWEQRDIQQGRFASGSSAVSTAGQEVAAPSTSAAVVHAPLRALAQLYATYIVADGDEGVMLIDQHAAQERTMFERLMSKGGISESSLQGEIQSLLLPETIELGLREASVLRESLEFIRKFGIDIAEFGEQEFIVRALPVILAKAPVRSLILGLVDELIEGKKGGNFDEHLTDRIAMRACKLSVKANERLDLTQMQAIVDQLLACEQPYSCPHGRPTMVRLELAELERLFGRR